MNESEYLEQIETYTNIFNNLIKKIHIEYGLSQAEFEVGDIIDSRGIRIKIFKISCYLDEKGISRPKYTGDDFTKLNKKRKNGEILSIYHSSKNIELITTEFK